MSTSITQATNIVADAVGVRVERVRQVARRLVEDGHLPKSAGRYIADIGGIDIIKLLLAAVADTRLPDVSGSMRALFDLRCATGRTLGHTLYELLATVQTLDEGAEAAVDGLIEIEAETPRATITLNISRHPVEAVFTADGSEPTPVDTARKLFVVPTVALAKIALALGRNGSKRAAA